MKFNVRSLLIMLTALAALPGCGKSNGTPANPGVVTNSSSVSSVGSSGQCANVTANTAVSLTFSGTLQQAAGLQGQLSIYGYGSSSYGGSNYYRNLVTGDSVNVYVSGSTAYAVIAISANTATAIVQGQSGSSYNGYNSNGTAQVCGMYINETIFASAISGSGYTGTMGGGTIALRGPNSWISYGGQYILF
jgi:hypothetical protein